MTQFELPRSKPEQAGFCSLGLDRLDQAIQSAITKGKIPGAVVGLARRGQVAYLKAHGVSDEARQTPMQTDALFQMASSTKPVLGIAAMMMVEQELFQPGDLVEKYIPEFKDIQVAVLAEPTDQDISPLYVLEEPPEHRLVQPQQPLTIHHLLTHTSGLAGYGLGMALANWNWQPGETLASWIPKVAAGPLDFQPGSRWMYSPFVGLDVVARIIEIVSACSFEEFVQKHIFNPLDMRDTHWVPPEEKSGRLVVMDKDPGVFRGDKVGFRSDGRYFSGSVGLVSTARDYLHFENMLLNGGTLFGQQLLKPESIATMSRNQVGELYRGKVDAPVDGLGFGYTVGITQDAEQAGNFRSTGAFGWGGAFVTLSWVEPQRELTVVVMVQKLTEDFHNIVGKAVSEA